MTDQDQAPKIQIDDDWKSQAQAEKQRLSDDSKKSDDSPSGDAAEGRGKMPEASVETLISTMATTRWSQPPV